MIKRDPISTSVCRTLLILTTIFACSVGRLSAQTEDDLIPIIKGELDREMKEFKAVNPSPYYVSYQVHEAHTGMIAASFGSITEANQNAYRQVKTTVRVGDYGYDNTHREDDRMMDGEFRNNFSNTKQLPLENNAHAIRQELWLTTQREYQSALKAYQSLKKKDDAKLNPGGDFSKEDVQSFVDGPLPDFEATYHEKEWKERIKQLTTPFLDNPDIIDGSAQLRISFERNYLISSEGTVVAQNRISAYLFITAAIRTLDGDVAPLHLSYFASKPSGLPSSEQMLSDVKEMIRKLVLLRAAPKAEPYTGPAILYARVAGVFFHEIFGHRIEGHRFRDRMDAQTFKGMLGAAVLPRNFDVISDPTLSTFSGKDLNGYYRYDDEGVASRRVNVVEKGVLKTFLLSRSPMNAEFPHSNGHGRGATGASPVSRQSNLIVVNEKPTTMKNLRKMLVAECKRQGKAYGYLFMDVTGGFTMTNRFMPNAFNIFPMEVYRVYVDGKPDELVHGVNLIGTPLSMFAEIKGTDNVSEVFTGFCGAESGSVPVTAISPSILVNRIETQKKIENEIEQSILPRPGFKD